jgi:uncharacterized iron-regulated membrane protein
MSDDQLKIGSRFFYPLHYSLNLQWKSGLLDVGFAALAMLAALVSGVVMHRKIFREFFTFRPKKATQRSTLDLHNMTGVRAPVSLLLRIHRPGDFCWHLLSRHAYAT